MPELPEVERERRRLAPAMVGARFRRVRLNRPDLRRPFPSRFVARLRGQQVLALERRGKYLVAKLSSGDTLLMHLGMSGSFRIEPTTARRVTRDEAIERRHDHVVFTMSTGVTVTYNDPRRFGSMTLATPSSDPAMPVEPMEGLGPEPLTRAFHASALASRCAGRRIAVKVALLDQRVVAGLGNIYASEALHLARVSPFRSASGIATAAGRPRAQAKRLAAAIKAVLRRAISVKHDADERFRYTTARENDAPRRVAEARLSAPVRRAGRRSSVPSASSDGSARQAIDCRSSDIRLGEIRCHRTQPA